MRENTNTYIVPERKVNFSLSQRGRVRVGVNDISGLYFPPPAPPTGRGVFVQASKFRACFVIRYNAQHGNKGKKQTQVCK